ncbi:MAG: MFS transporter [Desulfobacteraceae bacterium]
MKKKYYYGYNIVAAGFVTQAVCIGAMFTYGVFFKELQIAFGWSRAMISGASSMAFLIMGGGAALAGGLNDRIGPRIILTTSAVVTGIGYLLMAGIQSLWQLYLLYGCLVGVGFATHDVVTLSTAARWFVKRRGTMSGILKVGTGAGQLTIPLIASSLIAAYGWRQTYLILGGFTLIALVCVVQLMRRDPQSMGLQPDGALQNTLHSTTPNSNTDLPLAVIARSKLFWYICMAEFAAFFSIFTIVVHIVPHARDIGLSPTIAAGLLSTIGGVSMLGRVVMGAASDRLGGRRSLIICFIMLLASLVWLLLASNAWLLYLFAIVYGFAHGSLFTVVSPAIAELFGTNSHGLLFGFVLFSGTLGGSIGPLLAGFLFDQTGTYKIVFMVLMLMAAFGLFLVTLLRPGKNSG